MHLLFNFLCKVHVMSHADVLVRKPFYTYYSPPPRTFASTHHKETHARHVYICSTTHCLLRPRFIPQCLLKQENLTYSPACMSENRVWDSDLDRTFSAVTRPELDLRRPYGIHPQPHTHCHTYVARLIPRPTCTLKNRSPSKTLSFEGRLRPEDSNGTIESKDANIE